MHEIKKAKVYFWLSYIFSSMARKRQLKRKIQQHKTVIEDFKKNWDNIKNQKRVEIHISSLSHD